MDRENWIYFDGTREVLEEIDTEPLLEDEGYIVPINLEYGVYEDDRGIFLILVDLENSYSWVDSIYDNWDKIDDRVAEIEDTIMKINWLDMKLLFGIKTV